MIVLMASFWLVEAMPLYVTALLPVALLPLLGIQSTGMEWDDKPSLSVTMTLTSDHLPLQIKW